MMDIDIDAENEFSFINNLNLHVRMQMFFDLVNYSPNLILITDLSGNIVFVNKAFCNQTGYEKTELLGKNPRLLKSGKVKAHIYKEMWDSLNSGKSWNGEFINKRKDGSFFNELAFCFPIKNKAGKTTNYCAIETNITKQKELQNNMNRLAYYDQLTGLPNRSLLLDRAKYLMGAADRSKTSLAIMFLDLDHFKNINDSLGHDIGDEVLVKIANTLKDSVRAEGTVSRFGGDEFVLLFPDVNFDKTTSILLRLIEKISLPHRVDGNDLFLTPSIGVVFYPQNGKSFNALIKKADTAMYKAKADGRNCYHYYTESMQRNATRKLTVLNALRHATQNKEIEVHYQPQISLHTKKIIGSEALARWKHPVLGDISPLEFIPLAEENGLIDKLGAWILERALEQTKKLHNNGHQNLKIAVNVSSLQFSQIHFLQTVLNLIKKTSFPAECLELELTETITMRDPKAALAILQELYNNNIKITIDDFGTGYSSLNYLKYFKAYKLKVDKSFISDISSSQEDKAIVCAIIKMSKALNVLVIAEGVETQEQIDFLVSRECDEIQGYYFSKPLCFDDFVKFVDSHDSFAWTTENMPQRTVVQK